MRAIDSRVSRNDRGRFLSSCAAAACVGLLGAHEVHAQATWDMASLEQNVPPIQHPLNGFTPILPYSLPIPSNDQAVTLQQNGTLGAYAAALAARGVALPVRMYDQNDTAAGAIATALTLQTAGLPIHVWTSISGDTSSVPPGFGHDQGTAFWPWGGNPNAWAQDSAGNYWPAFPLATPTAGYNWMKNNLQTLANGGISSITGVWTDYEDYPAYWVDMKASINQRTYFSQYYTDSYAAGNGVLVSPYGPTLLTNDIMDQNNQMWKYSYDLRYALLKQSARQALTDVFGPTPVYGNYGLYFSTTSTPYTTDGRNFAPPSPAPEGGMAAMPVAYADTFYLSNDFILYNPANVPVNQTTVDNAYWYNMLTQISSSQANDGTAGQSVDWVSYYVPDNTSPTWVNWAMSTPVYKELLRHIWLRGASGMYVFNVLRTPQQSFNELAYTTGVLDEMLSFRTFLTNGAPMNFSINSSLFSGAVEWSGMSNDRTTPTQWVVRTVSRTGSDSVVPTITPQPGLTFTNVPAPASGATFILNADGSIHRVDSEPAAAYLQFQNEYLDSSGNGLNGVPGQNPSTDVPPTMTADVPSDSSGITSVLNGQYGLYANQADTYSVRLSRDPSSYYTGSFIRIPDTGGAFNSTSFTVEVYVKVASGISQDSASIISKGLNAGPGGFDWSIQYRDFAGAGMVELTFVENSTTYAWIRTSGTPLTPDVWHHLAMTYNGTARQVTLYVDGVAQLFGNHDDQISATGVLDWAFEQHTGDNIVLGNYDRGIDATFNDFRFTPAALDPLQMLTIGKLD